MESAQANGWVRAAFSQLEEMQVGIGEAYSGTAGAVTMAQEGCALARGGLWNAQEAQAACAGRTGRSRLGGSGVVGGVSGLCGFVCLAGAGISSTAAV